MQGCFKNIRGSKHCQILIVQPWVLTLFGDHCLTVASSNAVFVKKVKLCATHCQYTVFLLFFFRL